MKDYRTRGYHLPRLPRPYYQADAMVHWTLTLWDRATGWLSGDLHARWRELLLHCSAREGLLCPAYCLMPDHLHLLWMGLRPDSDQLNAMAFLRTHFAPELAPARLQPQAHDHVLRETSSGRNILRTAISYDLLNPVRKGLVNSPKDWVWHGCVVPGYPKLHPLDDHFEDVFWRLYSRQRDPRCDAHTLPPFP
jgi:putative transposase